MVWRERRIDLRHKPDDHDAGRAREYGRRECRRCAGWRACRPASCGCEFSNGANASNFDLAFEDGRTFHIIASDGGYLPRLVAVTRLVISPGEKFEVLVDFSDGRAAVLETGSDSYAPMMGMMRRRGGGSAAIMKFDPVRTKPVPVKTLPSSLVDLESQLLLANHKAATLSFYTSTGWVRRPADYRMRAAHLIRRCCCVRDHR